ncbi:MAG: polyhydroxyalkanoate synthesis regulator DNA-binding domain-containing protein [Pseudomonadota bacterium]
METIELRRYPSRKLYNKTASRYVKLPDVAQLIRDGYNIHVEDTETGEDVTRQLLLQLIMEQEADTDQAILSSDVLTEMIRAHQSKAAELMTDLFDQSFGFLRAQQERLASSMSATLASPWTSFDPKQFEGLQSDFQERVARFWGIDLQSTSRATEAAAEPAPRDDVDEGARELKALRDRLERLEQRMSE